MFATPSIMDLGKQLLDSAKEGEMDRVHDLRRRGAPFITDWSGKSALHMAVENNHLEICKILLNSGIKKDSRTKLERTPLHLAVCNGHEKIVELLLEAKCDVNAQDMMKMTPLHWAVENDHPNLVKLLLKYDANPNAESKHDETPISIAKELDFQDIFEMLSLQNFNMNTNNNSSHVTQLSASLLKKGDIKQKTVDSVMTNPSQKKLTKAVQALPSNDENMIEIPQSQFQFLLDKMENLQRRLTKLERHCDLDGSTII